MSTAIEWLATFQANSDIAAIGSQNDPHIVGLSNGNFLVAWDEGAGNAIGLDIGFDIVGKIFDAQGNVVRDSFQINTGRVVDNERDFDIAATNDGGFIMAYVDDDISNAVETAIVWERYDSTGSFVIGADIASETSLTENLSNPQIAVDLTDNSALITFTRATTGDLNIRAIAVDANGSIGAEFDAGQNSPDFDIDGDVAILSNGNYVSVYEEGDTGSTSIEFQIVTAAGNSVAGPSNIGSGSQIDPHVAGLANGNFVVVWNQFDGGDSDVRAEIRTSTGDFVRSNFVIAATADFEGAPAVVALPQGGFVTFWDNDTDGTVEAQSFLDNGDADGSVVTIDTQGREPGIGVTADGRVLFSWEDVLTGEISASIWDPRGGTVDVADYTQVQTNFVKNTGPILGSANADAINGDSTDSEILGLSGDDFINGGGGDDTMNGGLGDDIYVVGAAGDVVVEATNEGYDTVQSYLTNYTLGDNVESLELKGAALKGTGNELDNALVGNDLDNMLNGLSGSDYIVGGGGNDIINGGADTDTLLGGAGDDRYFVDLSTDSILELAGEGTDTAISGAITYALSDNVERLELSGSAAKGYGNSGNNTLVGTTGDNRLEGNGGADYIVGGDGVDLLLGGAGADRFAYFSTDHSLAGPGNRDTIFDFGNGSDRIDLGLLLAGDSFAFVGTSAFSGADQEVRYLSFDGNQLVEIDVTGNGTADMQILLANTDALDAGDFVL